MLCLTITLHPEDVGRQPQKTIKTVVMHAIATKKTPKNKIVSDEFFRVSLEGSYQFHLVSPLTSLRKLLTCVVEQARLNPGDLNAELYAVESFVQILEQ